MSSTEIDYASTAAGAALQKCEIQLNTEQMRLLKQAASLRSKAGFTYKARSRANNNSFNTTQSRKGGRSREAAPVVLALNFTQPMQLSQRESQKQLQSPKATKVQQELADAGTDMKVKIKIQSPVPAFLQKKKLDQLCKLESEEFVIKDGEEARVDKKQSPTRPALVTFEAPAPALDGENAGTWSQTTNNQGYQRNFQAQNGDQGTNFLKYSAPEFSDYLTYLHTDNFYDCQFQNRMQNAIAFAKMQDALIQQHGILGTASETKTPNVSTEYGTQRETFNDSMSKRVGKVKNIIDLNQQTHLNLLKSGQLIKKGIRKQTSNLASSALQRFKILSPKNMKLANKTAGDAPGHGLRGGMLGQEKRVTSNQTTSRGASPIPSWRGARQKKSYLDIIQDEKISETPAETFNLTPDDTVDIIKPRPVSGSQIQKNYSQFVKQKYQLSHSDLEKHQLANLVNNIEVSDQSMNTPRNQNSMVLNGTRSKTQIIRPRPQSRRKREDQRKLYNNSGSQRVSTKLLMKTGDQRHSQNLEQGRKSELEQICQESLKGDVVQNSSVYNKSAVLVSGDEMGDCCSVNSENVEQKINSESSSPDAKAKVIFSRTRNSQIAEKLPQNPLSAKPSQRVEPAFMTNQNSKAGLRGLQESAEQPGAKRLNSKQSAKAEIDTTQIKNDPLDCSLPLHSPIAQKIEKVYRKIDRFNKNQRQVLKASGEIDMAKVKEFSELLAQGKQTFETRVLDHKVVSGSGPNIKGSSIQICAKPSTRHGSNRRNLGTIWTAKQQQQRQVDMDIDGQLNSSNLLLNEPDSFREQNRKGVNNLVLQLDEPRFEKARASCPKSAAARGSSSRHLASRYQSAANRAQFQELLFSDPLSSKNANLRPARLPQAGYQGYQLQQNKKRKNLDSQQHRLQSQKQGVRIYEPAAQSKRLLTGDRFQYRQKLYIDVGGFFTQSQTKFNCIEAVPPEARRSLGQELGGLRKVYSIRQSQTGLHNTNQAQSVDDRDRPFLFC